MQNMAFNAANIKAEVPELRWRTLSVPFRNANIDGQHVQARRPYPYLDVVAHEPVRRDSEVITAELLFLNTLEPDLYPDRFRTFYAALQDKSAGPLVHPARGLFRAVVTKYSVLFDEQTRAGVIVSVTWEEDREDAATPPAEADVPPDAKEVAKEADTQYAFVRALYPTSDEAEPGTDDAITAKGDALVEAYDLAFENARLRYPTNDVGPQTFEELFDETLGDVQTEFVALSGKFAEAAGVVADVSDAVELLQDPALWPALLAFREAHRAFSELALKYGEGDRPIGRFVTEREMPLDEIAEAVNASVDDLVQLNPTLLSTPWIAEGATVRYYLA
jgi:hypothetical protein